MTGREDEVFIKQALSLAKKGMGWTNPNPMVGAVILKNGSVIGKGFHKKAGLNHAEIEALKSCTENPRGATLYVNLEPCCLYGKTPPCTEAIIKSKIARLVCSTKDPNPKVNGKGLEKLRKSGIKVSVGIMASQAKALNEAFFFFHSRKRPFIALKFASSLDGKIATYQGDSKWITSEKARQFARSMRGQYQAILVGIGTIIKDNPHLGIRESGKKDPLRIILDPALRIPLNSRVLRDNHVLLVTTSLSDNEKLMILKQKNFTILKFSGKQIPLQKLLAYLKEKEVISVLVEGGSKTLGYFVDSRFFDKVYAFYAPVIIGGEKAKTIVEGEGVDQIKNAMRLEGVSFKRFDDNLLVSGYFKPILVG